MAIPKYDELYEIILEFLKDRSERIPRELELPLATQLGLSDEEISRLYDSGNGPIFFDRIAWSLSYLSLAGLVEKPKRGIYKISDKGLQLLSTPAKHSSGCRTQRKKSKCFLYHCTETVAFKQGNLGKTNIYC